MKLFGIHILVITVLAVVSGCKQTKNNTLFQLKEDTGIDFINEVKDGRKENSFLFRNFYNGGGVAIGDINNDGLADVFLSSNMGYNKLYLNKGNFQFQDISDTAGIIKDDKWNTGVVFADVNSDGWLDIYVCSSGHMPTGNRKNKLYINDKNLHFTEAAAAYGLDISAYTTQVSFFDYDLDGDLDCFMINNSPIPVNQLEFANKRDLLESKWPVGDFLKGGGDHLFRNDNGKFSEVTQQAGIHGTLISFGMGVSVGDINNDGFPDVYVANDSYERDYLYMNQQDGTFKDELETRMPHTSFSSMGADIADINNDGFQDVFTTDMLPLSDYRIKTTGAFDDIDMFNRKIKAGFHYHYVKNCLQLNSPSGQFKDIANYAGVAATDWSWGALMFDMDNDGWNDIYVCNGVNRDVTDLDFMNFFANDVIQKMVLTGQKDDVDQVLKEIPVNPQKNKVYRNDHALKFTDIGDEWGFSQPTLSNGAAYGDLDNDGDLDLIINNENQPSFVYQNNSRELKKNNYLGIILKGEAPNYFAVGAHIKLYVNGMLLTRELFPSRGFQSSMDYKQIIGIGEAATIDSVIITWPNRSNQKIVKPAINQLLVVQQSAAPVLPVTNQTTIRPTYFSEVAADFKKHTENEVIDFYSERNIPRLLSREGPRAATGDINGDGLEDVVIGGTPQHPAQVYLQNKKGMYTNHPQIAFQQFLSFEDAAIALLDYDKDNDLDLLICPGGNNNDINTRELQLRLFNNDGKGNFTINVQAFPEVSMNVAVAAVHDFNEDGFPDIFIGSRNFPRDYGRNPQHFLFVNDTKGSFKDILSGTTSALTHAGMITKAAWADITGDTQKELIIAGEWMPPTLFAVQNNKVTKIPSNLDSLYGWWQTFELADFNKDGKMDLVLGNIGENFYLRPTLSAPVKLWLNDFDKNGETDKILTYSINGKDKPVMIKHNLEEQIPSIKKTNLKHAIYAEKSVQQLFGDDIIQNTTVKQFNYAASIVAINKENAQFSIQKLPVLSQMSCLNALVCLDINNDGYEDIVGGGNQFGFLPQFERLDASGGEVLLNDGKGNFKWMDNVESGLFLKGELRDIRILKRKDKKALLFLQNNEVPVLYQLNTP